MEHVRLSTNYYRDDAVMRAGEAAEVLFTRALAHCGDQETDGFVSREVLPFLTPARGTARAAALVREGIWEQVPGGWRFVNWEKYQITKADLDAKREDGRRRQQAFRQRHSPRNALRNAVTNSEVAPREVEVEVVQAAAAREADPEPPPHPRPAAAELPVPVAILASKLNAATPRLRGLRWDTLGDRIAEIERLLDLHGDQPLIDVAVATLRDPAPVTAAAFLGTWQAMPPPGLRLALVRPERCPTHDTTLSPAGVCNSCVADEKAGTR